jgi:hypothetical protein
MAEMMILLKSLSRQEVVLMTVVRNRWNKHRLDLDREIG